MKKFLAIFAVLAVIVGTVLLATNLPVQGEKQTEYLRIHVRANSNSAEDQEVKYKVKDEVVKYITPYIGECVTKNDAIEVMNGLLGGIEQVAEKALLKLGYDYGARASVREEKFPTRVYGDLTLEEGIYDALIVELGTGTGDNWWCVIYPPLCFTSATADVQYRSIIFDIINKFKNK